MVSQKRIYYQENVLIFFSVHTRHINTLLCDQYYFVKYVSFLFRHLEKKIKRMLLSKIFKYAMPTTYLSYCRLLCPSPTCSRTIEFIIFDNLMKHWIHIDVKICWRAIQTIKNVRYNIHKKKKTDLIERKRRMWT